MKKQIILGYLLLNVALSSYAMEEEQPAQQIAGDKRLGVEVLNLISKNPTTQQTFARELAQYWLAQSPNITYGEIVNNYQRTDANDNRTSVLPIPLLRALWNEIKNEIKKNLISTNKDFVINALLESLTSPDFRNFIEKASEAKPHIKAHIVEGNKQSHSPIFRLFDPGLDEYVNNYYDGNTPFVAFVRSDYCLILTSNNNASAIIHLRLPAPREFFVQVSNQLDDLELRNLLQADILSFLPPEHIFTNDPYIALYYFKCNHIDSNPDRLAMAHNLLNNLLDDALDRNQVRLYRDRDQALRDLRQNIGIDRAQCIYEHTCSRK